MIYVDWIRIRDIKVPALITRQSFETKRAALEAIGTEPKSIRKMYENGARVYKVVV